MLSIRIHSPQSGFIRKGRFSAILSPIKLTGDILLHDDRGMFALAKAEDCRRYEGDDHRAAGVTNVEKAALYANRPWLADIKLIQQFAQDDKPPDGDIAFMVRKGKGWADITQRVALVKALCREQAAGMDPELVAVSKAALEHLDGITPAPHAQHRALDLLTDTLGELTADEPLQPHVERMASEMARVQTNRHAYGMLKHVDPEQLMKINGECGMFSHVPRIKYVGREHLIVNMLKAEGYDKYRIYGCVQQGKAVFVEKYTDDYIGKVAPYQVHEFHKAENFYFIPLTVVKRYAVPVLLKRYKLGKLFAGQRELAEIIKQEISELDPDAMAALSTKEMKALLSKLADVTTESRGSAREQYLNSVLYLTAELNKRGESVELPKQLKTEVQRLTGLVKKDTAYEKESALIRENQKKPEAQKPHKFKAAEWTYGNGHPRCILCGEEEPSSGMCHGHKPTQKADTTNNGNASPLALANILQHVKPITLHEGYVKVSDDSDGFFHDDVQFNVIASMGDDATVRDAEMHIAKAFPPHIADRMKFDGEGNKGGVTVYDLALVPRGGFAPSMPVEKADSDPPDDSVITPMRPTPCADMNALRHHVAKHIDHGVAIEPRYIGDTLTVTKKGDAISIVDDGMRDVTIDHGYAEARNELTLLDGDIVLIAKAHAGDVVITDLIYHDESMTRLWHEDRRLQLETLFDGKDFSHMRLGKSSIIKSMADIEATCDDMMHDDGSRGIVAKALTSTYEHGDTWADVRLSKLLTVIVTKRSAMEITCAVGPVDDADAWRETVKVDKKHYAVIGQVEGKHNVKKGDTITVDALQLFDYEYADGQRGLSWTAPIIVMCKAESEPTTIKALQALEPRHIVEGESVKRWIVKAEDERYVVAVVLEPLKGDGDVDAQKDLYNAEEIRKAFFGWTEKHRRYGFMHQRALKPGDVVLCENYLAPSTFKMNGEEIRKGTWLQGIRVHDDTLWAKIKSGEIAGVSIGGDATRTATE